ncbi:MAG: acyl-CoA desaturase, partial [Nanoarchaeota archaeon]
FLAFVFVQFGLLMHDADHQQIFNSRLMNELAGVLAGNLVVNISSGGWTEKHNKHHSTPNLEGHDEDIDVPIMAYSEEQAMKKKWLARLIVKHQAYFWLFIITLTAYTLRFGMLKKLVRSISKKSWKMQVLELLTLLTSTLVFFGLIFHTLGLAKGVVFVVVNFAISGFYFGTIFAPNHKGMPILKEQSDFMSMQLVTSRNVRGSPIIDFLMGGLNYQIEHHLFPTMPRNNLKKAREIVIPFCREIGVEYHETGFFKSYWYVLKHFYSISAVLRTQKTKKSTALSSSTV